MVFLVIPGQANSFHWILNSAHVVNHFFDWYCINLTHVFLQLIFFAQLAGAHAVDQGSVIDQMVDLKECRVAGALVEHQSSVVDKGFYL